jgi:hypothetical protein
MVESDFERFVANELHCYYSSEVDDIDFTSDAFLQEDLPIAAQNSSKRLLLAVGDSHNDALATYLDELASNREHSFFRHLGDGIFDPSDDRDWHALQRIFTAIAHALRA